MFDTQILDNGTIQIPEIQKWNNEEIHVIVIFKTKEESIAKKNVSLSGSLKKYANPSLIDNETDIAWSNLKDS